MRQARAVGLRSPWVGTGHHVVGTETKGCRSESGGVGQCSGKFPDLTLLGGRGGNRASGARQDLMPAVSTAQPRAGKTLGLCRQRVHSAGPRGPAAVGGQEGTRPRAGHCVSEGHCSLCLGQGRGGPGGAEAAVWGLGPAYEVGKLIGPLGCQGSRERGPGGRWSRVPAGCGE